MFVYQSNYFAGFINDASGHGHSARVVGGSQLTGRLQIMNLKNGNGWLEIKLCK